MLRTVLAITLAAALLGAAMPVVDDARVATAGSQTVDQLESLDRAAEALADRNDPAPPGMDGSSARRHVVLDFPRRTWGSSGLERLRVPANSAAGISWRVESGTSTTWNSSVPITGPDGGITIREGGRVRLVLTLQRARGEVVVVVSRPDFMSDSGTRPTHADTSDPGVSDLRTQ